MIVVDRPGIGATPVVPLEKRIEVSCRKSYTSYHLLTSSTKKVIWTWNLEMLIYSACCFGVRTSKSQTCPPPSGISGDLVSPPPTSQVMADGSYTLHLLIHHPTIFAGGLQTPPNVYLVSPWSPLLPPDHPDYYPSYFTWIPTPLISTQHYTVRLSSLIDLRELMIVTWSSESRSASSYTLDIWPKSLGQR